MGLGEIETAVDAASVISFEVEIVRPRLGGEQPKGGDLAKNRKLSLRKGMIAAGIHVAEEQAGEREKGV